MNIYFFIIFFTLILIHIVDTVAQILNLRAFTPDLPKEFDGVYDPAEYKRSKEYTKSRTLFNLVESSFDLVILLAFWFLGGFNCLDILIQHYGYHPVVNGLLYFGILTFAKFILSLPFDIYSTFVIEEKFGFNKTTVRIFIMDNIKMIFLSALLGGLVLAGLLVFFQWLGPIAWLYAWLAVTIFVILLQFIAPIWIMPLFNKFTPLEDGELKTAIMNYAGSVQFPLKGLFVMDGSKRSSKSNAFFTGFGKNKRIALFDTLIEKHSVKELVAILAHEIGHYKKKHVLKNIIIHITELGMFFYLLSFFISRPEIFKAFFVENISIYAGFLFFAMLYSPISFVTSILTHIFSRHNEYEADRFAVETTKDSESFIHGLKQLVVANLGSLTPHPFYVFLYYSHPPILDRINAIRYTLYANSNHIHIF